jgi:hypothetical protein
MDYLALMACYAAGVISLIFATRQPDAGFLTHAFSLAAGAYLSLRFLALGANTHALSPVQWTGEAETGPLTLLVLLVAMVLPFVVGWERERDRQNRRRGDGKRT